LWPGNLYNILRVLASQIYTNLSAEPADTFEPSGDQAHRNKFYEQKIEMHIKTNKYIIYNILIIFNYYLNLFKIMSVSGENF